MIYLSKRAVLFKNSKLKPPVPCSLEFTIVVLFNRSPFEKMVVKSLEVLKNTWVKDEILNLVQTFCDVGAFILLIGKRTFVVNLKFLR
jgi:hypothetical protein